MGKFARRLKLKARLNPYKILLGAANITLIAGVNSKAILGKSLVGTPLVGCTQTFITVGAFDSEAEAINCQKYINTKFVQALLSTLKVTQHNATATWKNIPLQDFTSASDIDWSVPIGEIDKQLYRKYGLNISEIAFIEGRFKYRSDFNAQD